MPPLLAATRGYSVPQTHNLSCTMRIGILLTGHVHDKLVGAHGDYVDMFKTLLAGHGFEFSDYAVVDMEFPASVTDADGWLLTGSKHGAYEDLPFIAPLEEFIREAYARHVPMVGICFGHQIIAQALGGRVAKYEEGWAAGATEYDFCGETLKMNAWHQDQVIEKPAGAEVIARNPFCEFAALVYDDRIYSVQAHPEIGDAYLAGLLEVRAPGVVAEPTRLEALERIGTPLDSGIVANRIADFFKKPRAPHV